MSERNEIGEVEKWPWRVDATRMLGDPMWSLSNDCIWTTVPLKCTNALVHCCSENAMCSNVIAVL